MTPLPDIWRTIAWIAPLPGLALLFVRMVGAGFSPKVRDRLRALGWPLLVLGLAAMTGIFLWNSLATGDWQALTHIAGFLGLALWFWGEAYREERPRAGRVALIGQLTFFASSIAGIAIKRGEMPVWAWLALGAALVMFRYGLWASGRRAKARAPEGGPA